jgi:hypothetical protein
MHAVAAHAELAKAAASIHPDIKVVGFICCYGKET